MSLLCVTSKATLNTRPPWTQATLNGHVCYVLDEGESYLTPHVAYLQCSCLHMIRAVWYGDKALTLHVAEPCSIPTQHVTPLFLSTTSSAFACGYQFSQTKFFSLCAFVCSLLGGKAACWKEKGKFVLTWLSTGASYFTYLSLSFTIEGGTWMSPLDFPRPWSFNNTYFILTTLNWKLI